MAISHSPLSSTALSAMLQENEGTVPNLAGWLPVYPFKVWGLPIPTLQYEARPVQFTDAVIDISNWLGQYPAWLNPIPRLGTGAQQAFATNIDFSILPSTPPLSWQSVVPAWLPLSRPVVYPEWFGPVEPIAPMVFLGLTPALTADVKEQSSGAYRVLLVDELGRTISPFSLSSLTLTLYVISSTGTISYVNNRHAQDILNVNNVRAYDAPQLRATGSPFNLRWSIQPADTTLVDTSLPFERHLALFTAQWPTGKIARHEIVINVKNLGEV